MEMEAVYKVVVVMSLHQVDLGPQHQHSQGYGK